LLASRVFDPKVQRALLFWWNFFADYCGGHNGLHGPSSELHDVTAVRVSSEKGKFQKFTLMQLFATVLGEES
jgi:hypothetical protein